MLTTKEQEKATTPPPPPPKTTKNAHHQRTRKKQQLPPPQKLTKNAHHQRTRKKQHPPRNNKECSPPKTKKKATPPPPPPCPLKKPWNKQKQMKTTIKPLYCLYLAVLIDYGWKGNNLMHFCSKVFWLTNIAVLYGPVCRCDGNLQEAQSVDWISTTLWCR